ncbi:MAG: hypothetical protein B7Y90_00020 [Alphaproteobacteria bacterium 32-64-14]|nr:MAG: hypothetical protein B7Y90_00020 [Alphaproteobacteria bacterium 32-64-14]
MPDLQYKCLKPAALSLAEASLFRSLVAEGAQVTEVGLDNRIAKSRLLAFALSEGKVCCTGALKNPADEYRNGVFAKADSNLDRTKFTAEIGWVYVPACYGGNGVANKLVGFLLEDWSQPVFATTRTDNQRMRHILGKFGFSISGKPYASSEGPYDLALLFRA